MQLGKVIFDMREFLIKNRDEAIFCGVGIVISCLVAYYLHRHEKPKFNPKDYFSICKRVKDLMPEGFGIREHQSYYHERPCDEEIIKALAENSRVLVIGRPRAGKTRAVFETVNYYPNYHIYMPHSKKMDISEIDAGEIEKKSILFLDDLNRFTGRFSYYELYKKFHDASDDLRILATCRTGEEADVFKDEEIARFVATFSKVIVEDISEEEGKIIAENAGIDFLPSQFDGTVGSILLGLGAMRRRYERLEEQEKILLRLVKILAEGRTYSIEKNMLKKLFLQWIENEGIDPHQTFESSFQQLEENSFLREDDQKLVRSACDPYLEIIKYEVLDSDLLEMRELFCDLGYTEGLMNLGTAFSNRDAHHSGIECFSKVIKLEKRNEEAYLERGRIHAEIEEYDKALSDYNEAIRMNPESAKALYLRGLIYYTLREYDKALSDYSEATRINPEHFEAYFRRGLVYDDLGKHDKALSDYSEAIRMNPEHFEAYCVRGLIHAILGKYDKALSDYNEAIRINPDYAEAHYLRGVANHELKRYGEALLDYDDAIRIKPRFAEAYYNRGRVYGVLQKYHEAISDYNEAIRINPVYSKAYRNLGGSYAETEKFEDAARSFKKAAMLFLQEKKPQEALKTFFRCFELRDEIQSDNVILSGLVLYLQLRKEINELRAADSHLQNLQKAVLDLDEAKISQLEKETLVEDFKVLLSLFS